MDARLQRRVQRYGWDRAAECYEACWQKQLEPAQLLLLDMAALREGERVLDVACGTGLVTFPAASAVGATGEVLGTDISEAMTRSGEEIARERGVGNVRFARMEAESLEVDDASFDAALCALGLMYVPDPRLALEEMRRALRPAGRAVAAVWGRRDRCGWAEIFEVVDRRVHSEVCPLFFQLGTGESLRRRFEDAGYADVTSVSIDTTLHYASEEEACAAAFAGGPVALAYSRFDEQTRKEAHEEYLASIAQYRSEDGYAIPGEFVVVRGKTR